MHKLLVINPGSTSCKFSFFEDDARYAHFTLEFSENVIQAGLDKAGTPLAEIDAIGVRIVHGGDIFSAPALLDSSNLEKLRSLSSLAPLHNPPALNAIDQILKIKKDTKIIGVFDNAFHQTIPAPAHTYALPKALTAKHNIRRFGFHGTACQNVYHQAKNYLGYSPNKMIICHLGGGASITAVRNGESVETSMGFTPLEGLMMVTRSGDTDFGALAHLAQKENLTISELNEILNKKSGFLGLTGSTDIKTIVDQSLAGDKNCRLAVDTFVHRIVKYIGAYIAVLGGLDVLAFSGGIGEGNAHIRAQVCQHLPFLELVLDPDKNEKHQTEIHSIHAPDSQVNVLVAPVAEDEEIHQQVLDLLEQNT